MGTMSFSFFLFDERHPFASCSVVRGVNVSQVERLRQSCSEGWDWAQWEGDDHHSQAEPIEQTSYRFQQEMPAGSEVTRQLKDVVADSREHKGEREPAGLGLRLPFFCR